MIHWGTANATPATSSAGQTAMVRLAPAYANINQNGISTEKNGSWRPTITLSDASGSPVTPASATTGVPSAPNATGAVLAITERPDASSGGKPSRSSSAPVI